MTFLKKMVDYIRSWFKLAEVGQSRSSITNPLQWAMVILIGAILLCVRLGVARWIVTLLAIGMAVMLVLFVFTYLFFMFKNPDVLRSEHFHLSKMAIERGLIGDNLHGLIEEDAQGKQSLQLEGGKK